MKQKQIRNRILLIINILLINTLYWNHVSAQNNIGIKTNLLYGGYAYTPNLGIEFGVGRHITLDISGGYNPWNLNNSTGKKKLVHFLVQPEFRYFFRNSFKGHYLGIHGLYSQYNIGGHELPLLFGTGSEAFRHEGSAYGGGISYGYQFRLGRHWNLELSAGAGVVRMDYNKYYCDNCGQKISSEKRTYFGPTKAGISIIYLLKGTEKKKRPKKPGKKIYMQPVTTQTLRPVSLSGTVVRLPRIELPEPKLSTADSLARHYSFVVPVSEFERSRKAPGEQLFDPDMPLNMGKGLSAPQQNTVERFIADNEKGAILLYFSRAESVIDRYYKENNLSLVTLASVLKMIQASTDSRVEKVVVAGFASPDGLLAYNDRLAWGRASAVRRFILANSNIPEGNILIYNGSEDWRGLRRLVEESDIEKKSEIVRIIDEVPITSGREKRLMELAGGRPYRYMAEHFFPRLRNAAYIKVYYNNTKEAINKLYK